MQSIVRQLLLFISCLLLLLLSVVQAAPVASPEALEKRVAEPIADALARRIPQGNMGGSSKDWKREASPQGNMGGSSKDWKRAVAM